MLQLPNGEVYSGTWSAGVFTGRGPFQRADGYIYEGEWEAGKQAGKGEETLPSG